MPTVYKRLGAAAGSGAIATGANLYTCPAGTSTVVSSIVVCNASSTAYTYSIGISTTSATYQAGGYIVFQATVPANDTVTLTLGLVLDATNKFLVTSSSNAAVNFSVYGSEIS